MVLQKWSKLYNGIFNITLAEKGSVTFHNGKEYYIDAIPVKNIVDTTGCGDSYHAAFIASYLNNNNVNMAMEVMYAKITLGMYSGVYETHSEINLHKYLYKVILVLVTGKQRREVKIT